MIDRGSISLDQIEGRNRGRKRQSHVKEQSSELQIPRRHGVIVGVCQEKVLDFEQRFIDVLIWNFRLIRVSDRR
jgi:hypothetical protein